MFRLVVKRFNGPGSPFTSFPKLAQYPLGPWRLLIYDPYLIIVNNSLHCLVSLAFGSKIGCYSNKGKKESGSACGKCVNVTPASFFFAAFVIAKWSETFSYFWQDDGGHVAQEKSLLPTWTINGEKLVSYEVALSNSTAEQESERNKQELLIESPCSAIN